MNPKTRNNIQSEQNEFIQKQYNKGFDEQDIDLIIKNYFNEFLTKTELQIEELNRTNDQQIINDCLILYEKEYINGQFKRQKDFKYLYAPNL